MFSGVIFHFLTHPVQLPVLLDQPRCSVFRFSLGQRAGRIRSGFCTCVGKANEIVVGPDRIVRSRPYPM